MISGSWRFGMNADMPPMAWALVVGGELFCDAEDVVPAAGVEARRVLAQFVEDLVHLEGGEDRLDEDRGLDGAPWDPEGVLGMAEHVIPEACLEVPLELRQVEVGAASPVEGLTRSVEEGESEVDE